MMLRGQGLVFLKPYDQVSYGRALHNITGRFPVVALLLALTTWDCWKTGVGVHVEAQCVVPPSLLSTFFASTWGV